MFLKMAAQLNVTFSQWFLLKRRSLGLTQDQIAEKLGVSAQTISNWEKERSVPNLTINQIKDFCEILQCSLDQIPKTN
jgi:DNA-binding XRE family transcriptional regulator